MDNTNLPQRKNIRAEFHDYSGGDYFVTICTRDKKHYFGEIVTVNQPLVHNEIILTEIGKYCRDQLDELSIHYPYAEVPLFVVMPNHIHAIIVIKNSLNPNKDTGYTNIHLSRETSEWRRNEQKIPKTRTALSVIVSGLKRAVTLFARRNCIEFGWQSLYHDHIIRGHRDGNEIAEYIENNVAKWGLDCYY